MGEASVAWPNAAFRCQVVRDPASIATILSCFAAVHSLGAPIAFRVASVPSRIAASAYTFVAVACRVAAGLSVFDT